MLVLSRKEGEEIIIDGNIRVVIVRMLDGRVKVGVDAPPNVKVLRSELKNNGESNGNNDRRAG